MAYNDDALMQRIKKACPGTDAIRRFMTRVRNHFGDIPGAATISSHDGVRNMILYLHNNKAGASDGFANTFFQECRDIIRRDPKLNISSAKTTSTAINPEPKEDITMLDIMNKNVKAAMSNTQEALALAAKITTGEAAIGAICRSIRPVVPLLMRSYVDNPVVQCVLANAIVSVAEVFAPKSARLEQMIESVRIASFTRISHSYDVNGIINGLLDSILPDAAATSGEKVIDMEAIAKANKKNQ